MKVTLVKSTPPPQPPPKLEKVIIELEPSEARELRKVLGNASVLYQLYKQLDDAL